MKLRRGEQPTALPRFFLGLRAPTWLPGSRRDEDRCCPRVAPANLECAVCGQFLDTCPHSQLWEGGDNKRQCDLCLRWCPGAAGRNLHKQWLRAAEMNSLPVPEPEEQNAVSAGRCYSLGPRGRKPLPASVGAASLGCDRITPPSACFPPPSLCASVGV